MSAVTKLTIIGIFILMGKLVHVMEPTLVLRVVNGSTTGWFDIFRGQGGRYGDPNDVSDHFKNEIFDHWDRYNITEVNMTVKVGDTVVSYFHFNGKDTDRNSWFSVSKLTRSYPDTSLTTTYANARGIGKIFNMTGEVKRRFFINNYYAGCGGDVGWLMVLDVGRSSPCAFDSVKDVVIIMYSPRTVPMVWETLYYSNEGRADFLEIYVDAKYPPTTTIQATSPDTTTSAPDTTTSASDTTTSAPDTTSASDTTTSAPDTTTSASDTSTEAMGTPDNDHELPCIKCVCLKQTANITTEELQEIVVQLKKELQIDKSKTSMSIRRKVSASDNRTSAQAMGTVGAAMLAVPLVLILISDMIDLCRYLQNNTRKLSSME